MVPTDDHLADTQDITLVLRLVLDRQGCFQRGQLIDIDAQLVGQFFDRAGLVRSLMAWLDAQRCPDTTDPV